MLQQSSPKDISSIGLKTLRSKNLVLKNQFFRKTLGTGFVIWINK